MFCFFYTDSGENSPFFPYKVQLVEICDPGITLVSLLYMFNYLNVEVEEQPCNFEKEGGVAMFFLPKKFDFLLCEKKSSSGKKHTPLTVK